jgi:hypothetical protein
MKKKYKLVNSYFKVAKYSVLPKTIIEIVEYREQYGELPFDYNGNNWVYDAYCEKQKREGVYNSQFLTPDNTVGKLMHFAGKYFLDNDVLEPCCGTGQITKELIKDQYNVVAFDVDSEMVKICNYVCGCEVSKKYDFRDWNEGSTHRNQIIANPPFEAQELTEFLEWIDSIQGYGGVSILLIPKGFTNKDKPNRTFQVLRKFGLLEKEDMQEQFERTNTRAEIVVLKKL